MTIKNFRIVSTQKYKVDHTTGKVYELRASELDGYEYIFIGNLNGRDIEEFLRTMSESTKHPLGTDLTHFDIVLSPAEHEWIALIASKISIENVALGLELAFKRGKHSASQAAGGQSE